MHEPSSSLWFSHHATKYDAFWKNFRKVFKWVKGSVLRHWDNCHISLVSLPNKKVRVVVRSYQIVHSTYRRKEVKVKFMFGFNVSDIFPPKMEDSFLQPPEINSKTQDTQIKGSIWLLRLRKESDGTDCSIWEEKKPGQDIKQTKVYKIYMEIKKIEKDPDFSNKNIFDIAVQNDNGIVPVIYQAAIDSLKNFLREVHCHKTKENEYEVTLIFNDERLRRFGILDGIYRLFRFFIYKRVMDVETFKVLVKDGIVENFDFDNIYSGKYSIEYDNIHEVKRNAIVRYYYSNKKHPVVFVNTSNHAMAEHDTNSDIWKWEYVPWEEGNPISFGNKSRKEIDQFFKSNGWMLKQI